MKFFSLIAGILILFAAWYNYQYDEVIIRIDDLTVEQEFEIPLKVQRGWVTRSFGVIENSANDTVRLGFATFIAPGWTGLLYHNDEFNSGPSTFKYQPYKATSGAVSIRFRVSK